MTQTMQSAIPLMDKGKTGYPRPRGARFGLVNHIEMHLHRLLGKPLCFLVNLTTGARPAQATPNAKASDRVVAVNGVQRQSAKRLTALRRSSSSFLNLPFIVITILIARPHEHGSGSIS
jgi:hypothetical protein